MTRRAEIIIAGAGFAGALLAMILRRQGRSVLLLERGRHPRFAIGESSTPLANLIFEHLAKQYRLPRLAPLAKWGSWQKKYPSLGCGLKRGFTFYGHRFGEPFQAGAAHQNELMVGASPNEEIADTHWFRADFDDFLVREAVAAGAEYWDEVELNHFAPSPGGVAVQAARKGKIFRFEAEFLVDATGPRGFLHRALELGEASFPDFPQTAGLYTHFRGVKPFKGSVTGADENPPYPAEQAAIHHVFPGGWIWILHFNNGLTSAGVAAEQSLANDLGLDHGREGWGRLLARLPSLEPCFKNAEPVGPFVSAPRLPFRSETIRGDRWILLPSAAGFIDPLLSSGFPLTLLGIARLAGIFEKAWNEPDFHARLEEYARRTEDELLFVAGLIAALYRHMDRFEDFRALTLLYFAAASFSEAAVRLGQRAVGAPFLLCERADFRKGWEECVRPGLTADGSCAPGGARLSGKISSLIEPVNIAGLGQPQRRHWYGVDLNDLRAGAGKLGVPVSAIERMIDHLGLAESARVPAAIL